MNIFKSASKIVLLAFAGALIAGLFLDKIAADQFMTIGAMIFTYYFTRRANKSDETNA